MKLHLYSLKNRLSGIYDRPFAEIYDVDEYCELLTQSLASAPVADLERNKEYDIYSVGVFDTKSGEIESCEVTFVMSLESICLSYLAAKVRKEDVTDDQATV